MWDSIFTDQMSTGSQTLPYNGKNVMKMKKLKNGMFTLFYDLWAITQACDTLGKHTILLPSSMRGQVRKVSR